MSRDFSGPFLAGGHNAAYSERVSTDCLFCRIVERSVPATIVHETDTVLAFRDIDPQADTHVLVIPKEHHTDAAAMAVADPQLAGEVLAAAGEVAKIDGVDASGYRLVFNTGKDANQTVFHVHCHVLGGRNLTWPPG
ncbi:HIT family hydrolase, diadenosine tetraphosphate hydrolase [Saccharomonospora glauca K62]|uniref:HIT family hydrolase, diadenosine tetraphosphate hydrolase n=1 Tax=Saccharomonospora glauca K62 TaxID=928724 RepID=I1D1M7_9PSEU|nr:HIT family hydrolase, diadenosine tetraphosphate hydrolase [Saccharomonospora glauca K62]